MKGMVQMFILYFTLFFTSPQISLAKDKIYGSVSNVEYFQQTTLKPHRRISSEILIPWASPESKMRFIRSDTTAFFSLANQFEAQINKFYCGPASASIVLNALRINKPNIKKPMDQNLYRGSLSTLPKDYIPVFERYTQDAFFNEKTDKIKTRNQVFGETTEGSSLKDYGLQIEQLGEMLKTYQVNVSIQIVADDLDIQEIKKNFIKSLKQEGNYIIVNYARPSLGQKGGGHISPIGAYDEVSDSVLIMDVNPSHQPWVWVKIEDLIIAMRTKDTVKNRGYLVVSDSI